MGDVSIIARRLPGGYVQYGWSGNGGYCRNTGLRLLKWYTEPDMVEYLFGLGETKLIGKPGSEKGGASWIETHDPTGVPFDLAKTERSIFSKIAFIDYGYFYDSDQEWYYIIPGPFRIKIPLIHIFEHLDEEYYEFDYRDEIEKRLASYIFGEYFETNSDFRDYLMEIVPKGRTSFEKKVAKIRNSVLADESPIYEGLFEKNRRVFDYFDDWVVVDPEEDGDGIRFKMKKKSPKHVETIKW